jgi:hypothetical protein
MSDKIHVPEIYTDYEILKKNIIAYLFICQFPKPINRNQNIWTKYVS